MIFNAFCLGEKKMDLNPFSVHFCCLNVTWESIIFITLKTTKIHFN